MHQTAYVSSGQALTKCGEVVGLGLTSSWTSSVTCPACTPAAWPSIEQQQAVAFGDKAKGATFDKLLGLQVPLDKIHPSIRLPGQKAITP